jgi:hypothetical protein
MARRGAPRWGTISLGPLGLHAYRKDSKRLRTRSGSPRTPRRVLWTVFATFQTAFRMAGCRLGPPGHRLGPSGHRLSPSGQLSEASGRLGELPERLGSPLELEESLPEHLESLFHALKVFPNALKVFANASKVFGNAWKVSRTWRRQVSQRPLRTGPASRSGLRLSPGCPERAECVGPERLNGGESGVGRTARRPPPNLPLPQPSPSQGGGTHPPEEGRGHRQICCD